MYHMCVIWDISSEPHANCTYIICTIICTYNMGYHIIVPRIAKPGTNRTSQDDSGQIARLGFLRQVGSCVREVFWPRVMVIL
jgi:hypothetical protein